VTKEEITVPYIVHESEMARAERNAKRLWVALLVAITLMVLSNVGWLLYISQYDFCSYELSTDGGGNANYIGQDGDIYNGESSRQEKDFEKSEES
jgi:hypothetical protein